MIMPLDYLNLKQRQYAIHIPDCQNMYSSDTYLHQQFTIGNIVDIILTKQDWFAEISVRLKYI